MLEITRHNVVGWLKLILKILPLTPKEKVAIQRFIATYGKRKADYIFGKERRVDEW